MLVRLAQAAAYILTRHHSMYCCHSGGWTSTLIAFLRVSIFRT